MPFNASRDGKFLTAGGDWRSLLLFMIRDVIEMLVRLVKLLHKVISVVRCLRNRLARLREDIAVSAKMKIEHGSKRGVRK